MRRPLLICLLLLAAGALLTLLRKRPAAPPVPLPHQRQEEPWVDNTPTTELPVLKPPSTTTTISGTLDDVL